MDREERRFTAAEWREIQGQYADQPKRGVRQMYPDPYDECDLGPFVPPGAYRPPKQADAGFRPRPHIEEWFSSLSVDDVRRLECLIKWRPETVSWIGDKGPKELKQIDGVVEFITSSRTAAKVLMWVGGVAVAFVGGVTALAKNGVDLFALFRGGR